MEVEGGSNTKIIVCVYEALGTALLVAAVNLSMGNAAAVGVALFAIAMFLGPVSGGHVNPAVTLAVLLREGLSNIMFAIMIMFSQLVGAVIGCLISFGTNHTKTIDNPIPGQDDIKIVVNGPARLCPPPNMAKKSTEGKILCEPYNGLAGFNMLLAEIIGTFIFISVIMSVKYHNGAVDVLNALTVGGTLFGVINIAGPVSGAAINPAVGLVQSIYMTMVYGSEPIGDKQYSLGSMWIYIVGPLIGGFLAGIWSKFNDVALSRQEEAKGVSDSDVHGEYAVQNNQGYAN